METLVLMAGLFLKSSENMDVRKGSDSGPPDIVTMKFMSQRGSQVEFSRVVTHSETLSQQQN